MAASRKLQGEIDRCLKKVSEGVETFEDIWQKVHNASNTNQKDKYETDLKKEIKKLQRLRDQIKSWIASGEIKDKSMLVDTRKLIETQMERFKVVERETKTKAFSKEGLGAAQKLDPTTREREEINNWLATSIDKLQIQIDQFESEIESLMVNKKKRLDKEKQDRLDELKNNMDRHKFHMSKLETLMRMLHNLANDINAINGLRKFLSQVKQIKDDIEYYLASSQEPEFEENEFLYDDIEGLEEVEQQQAMGINNSVPSADDLLGSPNNTSGLNSPISPIHSSSDGSGGGGGANGGSSEDPSQELVTRSSDDSSKVIRPLAMKQCETETSSPKDVAVSNSSPQKSLQGTPNNSSPSSGLSNHVSSLSSLSSSPTTQNHQEKSTPQLEHSLEASSVIDLIENNNQIQSQRTESPLDGVENSTEPGAIVTSTTTPPPPSSSPLLLTNSIAPTTTFTLTSIEPTLTTTSTTLNTTTTTTTTITTNGLEDETHLTNSAVSQSSAQNSIVPGVQSVSDIIRFQHEQMLDRLMQGDGSESMATLKSIAQEAIDRINLNGASSNNNNPEKKMMEAHIPPLLGVAPMGPVPLGKDHQQQFQMLEASSYHMPLPSDSERTRQFLPRNPFPTPHYYPQHPLTNSDTLEFFQRLSIETLFFIFYYLEGTKAQYLAAKVLKKQSWRFHTKYMMWFQRHEEPKVINEEYEQGTYIYFDIEKWGQRKKDGFVFEYRYLEDRDLC